MKKEENYVIIIFIMFPFIAGFQIHQNHSLFFVEHFVLFILDNFW
jgi:hypothetical protein